MNPTIYELIDALIGAAQEEVRITTENGTGPRVKHAARMTALCRQALITEYERAKNSYPPTSFGD